MKYEYEKILNNVENVEEMFSVLKQCKPWESDTVLMLSIIAAIQMINTKENARKDD